MLPLLQAVRYHRCDYILSYKSATVNYQFIVYQSSNTCFCAIKKTCSKLNMSFSVQPALSQARQGIVSLPAFCVMTNPGPVYEQYTIKTGIAYNIQQFNILHGGMCKKCAKVIKKTPAYVLQKKIVCDIILYNIRLVQIGGVRSGIRNGCCRHRFTGGLQ